MVISELPFALGLSSVRTDTLGSGLFIFITSLARLK